MPSLSGMLCSIFIFKGKFYNVYFLKILQVPATLETGSVFLSRNLHFAFGSPMDQNMTEQQMLNLMDYLTSNETSNDNFMDMKFRVKKDVQLLSQVLVTWRNMSMSSGMNNYIVCIEDTSSVCTGVTPPILVASMLV